MQSTASRQALAQRAPALPVVVQLAALGRRHGGDQVLEQDRRAGLRAVVRDADVPGRAVLERGLLRGTRAGGLVLARLLLLSSHCDFLSRPRWAVARTRTRSHFF